MSTKKTRCRAVRQVAALPLRRTSKGKLRVLMVTSRGTGRWVVPKGWPMKGRKAWQAAAQEALEEAGAVGKISKSTIGSFRYRKQLSGKSSILCEVDLFPMEVRRLRKSWREDHQRRRRWFSPKAASKRVQEKMLRRLLAKLDDDFLNAELAENQQK